MLNTKLTKRSFWKRISFILPALITVSLHPASEPSSSDSLKTNILQPLSISTFGTAAQAQTSWPTVEQNIITEHNRVRQNPQSYIPLLEAYLAKMDGQGNIPNGCGPNCTLQTQEGQSAVREAINFLKQQSALGPITLSSGLAQASKAHAQDQAGGSTGHTGSDGSDPGQRFNRHGVNTLGWGENIDYGSTTAQEVLMSLIIDDGVPGRGHRQNIFASNWTQAGAGCGPHAAYGSVCVIGYIKSGRPTTTGNNNTRSNLPLSPAVIASRPIAHNRLTVIHNGTVDLQAMQIDGVNVLSGPLPPGKSQKIALDTSQCRMDLKLHLAGGYSPLDWPRLQLCGATLTIDRQNGFGLNY